MQSLRVFTVLLDRSSATYMPGETVGGDIIVETLKDKEIGGLYFIAKGTSLVHWLESDPGDDLRSQNYTSAEQYFFFKYDIFATPNIESRHVIPSGYHQYPFSFKLPVNIPCSFEHAVGYVRYTIKAVIDRPWTFNHECKVAFSVVSVFDLNYQHEKCLSLDDETSKSFNCLCWLGQGSMNLQVAVPSTGYAPGQTIKTILTYDSSPNIPLRKVSAKLLQHLKFRATAKTISDTIEIKKTSQDQPILTNGRLVLQILIPAIPPSYLEYCNIINIEYELVVSVHVMGPYSKIKRNYPILIGTVPILCPGLSQLYNVVPYSSASTMLEAISARSFVPCSLSDPVQDFPSTSNNSSISNLEIPLPYYEESPYGTQSIKECSETDFVFGVNTPFAPKYPMFYYPTPSIVMNPS